MRKVRKKERKKKEITRTERERKKEGIKGG